MPIIFSFNKEIGENNHFRTGTTKSPGKLKRIVSNREILDNFKAVKYSDSRI